MAGEAKHSHLCTGAAWCWQEKREEYPSGRGRMEDGFEREGGPLTFEPTAGLTCIRDPEAQGVTGRVRLPPIWEGHWENLLEDSSYSC